MNNEKENGSKLPETSPINTGNGADTKRPSSIDNVPPHADVNKPGKTPTQGTGGTSGTSLQEYKDQYTDFSEQTESVR